MRVRLHLVACSLLALLIVSGAGPAHAKKIVTFISACTCEGNHGVERWAEKTDLAEPPTNKTEIRSITPATMASWGDAGGGVERNGRKGLETLFFSVTGRVTKVKAEDDGDLHLSLEDVGKPGRVVVEIPLGDRWCALRKTVFSWSATQFPLGAGRSLKLTREPIVTVVGKAFYDGGHASGANRRTYDSELAAWEIHPVMEITESTGVVPPPSHASAPTSTPSPATTPAATPGVPEFVVLSEPVTIRLPYGVAILAPGTRLQVVSHDGVTVHVWYLDQVYTVPAASTKQP